MVTTNIEISPYLYQFLVDKFGPEPIQFPQNSMFMRHLSEGCTPPSIGSSVCEYHERLEAVASNKALIKVCLPKDVFRCGRLLNVEHGWKLNYDSRRSFRKTADMMFWTDLYVFIGDYRRHRIINNEYFSLRSAIMDFISLHGIHEDHYDAIIRQYNRRKKEEKSVNFALQKGIVNYCSSVDYIS